jgi:hypothetical protein
MTEFERMRDLAAVVRKQASRAVILSVMAGTIDLDVAYQISCLPQSGQEQALKDHLEPPCEKSLMGKFLAMWVAASPDERAASVAAIAEVIGLSKDEKPKAAGVLFPDVEEEKQRAARMTPTDAEFEAFWKAFPCRVNKANARKAFTKAFVRLRKTMDCDQVIATIMTGADVYAKNANPERLCHPTTWLNGDRWADEPGSIWTGDKPRTKTGNATFGTYTDEERAQLQDAVF